MSKCGPTLSESEVARFEAEFNLVLPAQYRHFLLRFNGGVPTPAEFDFRPGSYGGSLVGEFLPLVHEKYGSLTRAIRTYKIDEKRFADDLISIASDPGGNQICIGIEGPRCGQVYFWDHEEESDDESEHNVYLIAPSFDEFLAGLRTNPRSEPKTRSTWMNSHSPTPEPTVQLMLWDDEDS